MSFQKFKTNCYCVGGRHHISTLNLVAEIARKKKTGEEIKTIIGRCSFCNRKKYVTSSVNTKPAEGLGDFFKKLCRKGLDVSRKMAKNVLQNLGRAMEIGANVAQAFVSRNLKVDLSTLQELINFSHTRKGLYFGKFVCFMLYKWNNKHQHFTTLLHYWSQTMI